MKLLKILLCTLIVFSLGACTNSPTSGNDQKDPGEENNCEVGGEITLENVNEFLNTSGDLGPDTIGNVVAVIPIDHVDGPRNESKFYAFVNFKYKARNYIKYQITYLSCTCRAANVNYWQTAYVELSLPESAKIEDAQVKFLSFDADSSGHYTGGFWGDSNPTPAGAAFETFKDEFIPFFIDKDYTYLKDLSVIDDIKVEDYTSGDGRTDLTLDTFSGSSVSTNNIIRMLNALMGYHGSDEFFTQQ